MSNCIEFELNLRVCSRPRTLISFERLRKYLVCRKETISLAVLQTLWFMSCYLFLLTVCQLLFILQVKGGKSQVDYIGHELSIVWLQLAFKHQTSGTFNNLPTACVIKLTTTFHISIHHLGTDSKGCAFTWSMSAKIVLHRKKNNLLQYDWDTKDISKVPHKVMQIFSTCILLSSSLSNTSATGVDSTNCTKPAKNETVLESDWIFNIQ